MRLVKHLGAFTKRRGFFGKAIDNRGGHVYNLIVKNRSFGIYYPIGSRFNKSDKEKSYVYH